MRSTYLWSLASRRRHNLVLLLLILVLVFVLDFHHQSCNIKYDLNNVNQELNDKSDPITWSIHSRNVPATNNLGLRLGQSNDVSFKKIVEQEKIRLGLINRSLERNTSPLSLQVDINANIHPDSHKDSHIFANISRIGKNKLLFAAIPEEPYFEENKRVFSQNVSVNNSFDYHLFIDGADVCTGGHQVFLLIIIPSTHGDWQERNAIRRTWLGAGERDLWPHRKVGVPVRHIFLLGLQTDVDVNMLQAESLQHGDLVLAGFVDSYRNLTTKMLVGLQWVQNYCPQAQIVLKVDQDTLINMPLIVALLWHVRERAGGDNAAFVLGLKHFHPKPVVKRTGKWRVSESEYPLPYFPAYVYGHTYALSSPSGVSRLLQAAHHVPLIAPEDAFITGVLPKVAGMVRLTSKAFTVCCRRFISRCEVVLNERVAFTSLDSGNHLDNLWTDIMRHECDPLRYERS